MWGHFHVQPVASHVKVRDMFNADKFFVFGKSDFGKSDQLSIYYLITI